MDQYHKPVLLHDSVDGLAIKGNGVYVDVTFGGGGHSREILSRLGEDGKLYGFDQDSDAVANKPDDKRFVLIQQNFKDIQKYLKLYNAVPVDGVLADLGVSSHQFDTAERGFSTRFDGPLDMRMNKKDSLTAAKVINTYEQDKLREIFRNYGELDQPGNIARVIVNNRTEKPINTGEDLKAVLKPFVRHGKEQKFFAKVFQALRIEVNAELDALEKLLQQMVDVIKPGGRLVVISYHSLEDRLVKNYMRSGKFEGDAEKDFYGNVLAPFKPLTRKAIIASDKEQEDNSRSRSAKLRIAERNG
jgi:16S rRNA (cytosine1402-N4)-methyltransferase